MKEGKMAMPCNMQKEKKHIDFWLKTLKKKETNWRI